VSLGRGLLTDSVAVSHRPGGGIDPTLSLCAVQQPTSCVQGLSDLDAIELVAGEQDDAVGLGK